MLYIPDIENVPTFIEAGFATITVSRCGDFAALVDADSLFWLRWFTWSKHDCGKGKVYARAQRCPITGAPIRLYMHHLVASLYGIKPARPECTHLDHKDGNGLNNRHGNLVWRTPVENRWGTARWPRSKK